MTDPKHTEPFVTQVDREAAAKCHEKSCYEIVRIQGSQCRNGYADGDYLVQAFARHRTAAEAASRAREDALVSLLTKAVGDIAAALEAAGSAGLIRKWTADYVAAINAHDARAALNPAAKGGE